jgi:hypothetical protein
MAEIGSVLHGCFQSPNYRDVNELSRGSDTWIVTAAYDDCVETFLFSIDDALEENFFSKVLWIPPIAVLWAVFHVGDNQLIPFIQVGLKSLGDQPVVRRRSERIDEVDSDAHDHFSKRGGELNSSTYPPY